MGGVLRRPDRAERRQQLLPLSLSLCLQPQRSDEGWLGARQLAEKSPNGGGGLVLTGEEVLLKELQQMRLQLAATQAEKSRLEQDNTELLKNCHFLVRPSATSQS